MKGRAEKGKEITRYTLAVIKCQGDVMYSTGTIAITVQWQMATRLLVITS